MTHSILVLDDDRISGREISLATSQITDPEFRILGIHSYPKKLIAAYAEKKSDIVSLDINMPGMSGIEVLRVLKSMDPEIRVIGITSDPTGADALTMLKNGAKAILGKNNITAHALKDTYLKALA